MSRTMREDIEFLKRDRSAGTDTFRKKLEEVGLTVYYGDFSYWEHQPYVEVGERKVFLVKEVYVDNSHFTAAYRSQNDVVAEIKEALQEEVRKQKKADRNVHTFFAAFKGGVQV